MPWFTISRICVRSDSSFNDCINVGVKNFCQASVRGSRETREKSDAFLSHQVHAIITQSALWLWSGVKKALTDPPGRQGLGDGLTPRLRAHKWSTNRLFALAPVGGL